MLNLQMSEDVNAKVTLGNQARAVPDTVGRVAHDLNNLFMLISSHAELLAIYHRDDADIQQRTSRILAAVSSATKLTHELQLLGRRE